MRTRHINYNLLNVIIFLLPGAALFTLFFLIPMGYSLNISFYKWNFVHPGQSVWVGLNNYITVIQNSIFQRSVINTLVYTVVTVFFQILIGLILALLLNQKFFGRTFFRISYYLPVISSWVIVSLLFTYIFNAQAGLANYILRDVFHITQDNIRWLADDKLIMVPLVLLGIWKGVGWTMVIFLAGLQGIPKHLYEAAAVDGAKLLDSFRYITLPLLRPTLVFLLVVLTIGGLNAYVSFQLIAYNGDPLDLTHSVLTWMYKTTFGSARNFGQGAAIGYLLTIFVFLISVVQLKLLRKPLEV